MAFDPPPKIAVLLPDLRTGGAEKLHVSLASEWVAKGFHVEFVLRQARGDLLESLPAGVTVVDLGAARVRNAVLPLARYLRREKPSVLLAAMWPLTVVAPLAAWLARYRGRIVGSEHSPLSLAYRSRGGVHRQLLSASQRVGYPRLAARIAVSTGVAEDLSALSSLPVSAFTVVHNPAATGRAIGGRDLPLPLANARRPVILTVGTLKAVKRQSLLLDAFSRLPEQDRGTLCIVGEGAEREALAAQARSLGLEDAVVMPGHVADPDAWYQASDLFVLCSDYEGFGNVIVEALEHGLSVVSTDCIAGPAEILGNGEFGRLVPVGDSQALADAMQQALSSPMEPEKLRRRARDFALDIVAERYLDILVPGWRGGSRAT